MYYNIKMNRVNGRGTNICYPIVTKIRRVRICAKSRMKRGIFRKFEEDETRLSNLLLTHIRQDQPY